MKSTISLNKISSEKYLNPKSIKRIQPLFKKKFSPLNSPVSLTMGSNTDNPNSFSPEFEFPNYELKHLYNEKLEIVKDLINYCATYDTSYSMRARIIKILKNLEKLKELIKVSSEQIENEIKFNENLKKTLEKVEKICESNEKDLNESLEKSEGDIKICCTISGIYCIATIDYNRNMTSFDISLHSSNSNAIYSYHLNTSLKAKTFDINYKFHQEILEKMHFFMLNGRLVVRFSEILEKEYILLIKIRGESTENCVKIRETGNFIELSISDVSLSVPKKEIQINQIKDLKIPGKKHQVTKIIESKISLINNRLEWGLSDWEIDKKSKKSRNSAVFKKVFEQKENKIEKNLIVLDDFEKFMNEGIVNILGYNAKVTMFFHTILMKIRILVEIEDFSIKVYQENYEKEFKFIKTLQKFQMCGSTFLRSLEFSYFLKGLIFKSPQI